MFGKIHLVGASFDMRSVQALNVSLVEDCFHRFHRLQLGLQLIHKLPLEHAPHAYEIFQKKEDGAIKILLEP